MQCAIVMSHMQCTTVISHVHAMFLSCMQCISHACACYTAYSWQATIIVTCIISITSQFNINAYNNKQGHDLNVVPAWIQGFTGTGVVVSVVDDGNAVTALSSAFSNVVCNYRSWKFSSWSQQKLCKFGYSYSQHKRPFTSLTYVIIIVFIGLSSQ